MDNAIHNAKNRMMGKIVGTRVARDHHGWRPERKTTEDTSQRERDVPLIHGGGLSPS